MLFYTGLNASPLLFQNNKDELTIDKFSKLVEDVTRVKIEWNYYLVWKGADLFFTGNFGAGNKWKQLILPEGNESK